MIKFVSLRKLNYVDIIKNKPVERRNPLVDDYVLTTQEKAIVQRLTKLENLSNELNELPERGRDDGEVKGSYKNKPWTEVEDLALLDFWPVKVQRDVARVLKRSVRDCIDRFAYLQSLNNCKD